MLSRAAAFASLLALTAPVAAQDLPPFDCRTFPKDATADSLAETFGAANVVNTDIDVVEGDVEPGTVLFPDDPEHRVEILWFDSGNHSRPASITVKETSAWTVRASSGGGIRIGSPLDAVQRANAKPFSVSGFGWDMGGWVSDWKGGKLDRLDGGCFLSIRFDPAPDAPDAALEEASGDRTFASSAAALRAVDPTVSTLSIGWAE